VLNKSVLLFAL